MSALKDGEQVVGNRTKVKVVKNKVAAPFREAEVDILYGEGISREGDLIDLGSEQGIVEKSGAWFSFAGERLGQGRDNARVFLKEHPEIRQRIDAGLREKIGLPKSEPAGAKPVAAEAPRSAAQTA
jgi:recombination protein RecA